MYTSSTLPGSSAVTYILDATGDGGDSVLRTKALRALRGAMQKWNNRTFWDWARTYTTSTFSSGLAELPSDVRAVYNLVVEGRVALYMNQRNFDLMTENQQEIYSAWGTPTIYDVSFKPTETSGWYVNLMRPASADSDFTLRYYRTLARPDDGTTAIDVPQDYEEGVLAMGTYLYLLNHGGDGRNERTQMWKAEAYTALEDAVRANQNVPDENVILEPTPAGPGIVQWYFPW